MMVDLSNHIVAKSILAANDNSHRFKDAKKFKDITKFIAKGREGSATCAYGEALGPITNTGEYTDEDIVGICVNGGGGRRRMRFDMEELMWALQAHATVITDNREDRNREYNSGEREVAEFLTIMGYVEHDGSGVWKPKRL